MKNILKETYFDLPLEDRHYFLLNLEFDDNIQKWDLFLDILKNPDELDPNYDLLAIEVLKILRLSEIPKNYVIQIVNEYNYILKNSKDDDIRNYTIISARNFINENEVLKDTIIQIMFNQIEFIVLRENAYFSILELNLITEKKVILEQVLEDENLSKYAKTDLKELK